MVNDEIYAALTPQIIIFCCRKNHALLNMWSKKLNIREKRRKSFLCLVTIPFTLNQMYMKQNIAWFVKLSDDLMIFVWTNLMNK